MRGTAGLGFQIFGQVRNAAGTVVYTASQNINLLTDGWQRITLTTAAVPADSVNINPLFRVRPNAAGTINGGFIEVDRVKFEIGNVASGWSDNGQVNASDAAANAAATTALTGRVTQTETGLTSVSGQLTQLSNNIGSMGGDNLLPNSSFETLYSDGTRPQFWQPDNSANSAPTFSLVDSPLASSTKALRVTRAALGNGAYIGPTFAPADGARPKVVAGQTYTLSAYARLSSAGARFAMYMVFVNDATKADKIAKEWLDAFVRILAPFAPHVAEELWQRLGHEESIAFAAWPEYDEAKLAVDTITLAVQVMGKMRGTIEVAADVAKDDAIAAAKADEKIAKFLEGKTIRREIYVTGRLVNIVAN